jgi:hypothetical protein
VALLEQHQMIASMSRPGNPYDNAQCESFMRTLKREEIYVTRYLDLEHLRSNLGEFIEQYYNRKRLHSALGYRSPEEFEQAMAEQNRELNPKVASLVCCSPWEKSSPRLLGNGTQTPSPSPDPNPLLERAEEIL